MNVNKKEQLDKIEQLLERYYDGLTSEAEEKELKCYFEQADVPPHLLTEKQFFCQMDAASPPVPEGLEDRLNASIDRWDSQERRSMKVKRGIRLRRLQWAGSIAASLLLLFSIGVYLHIPQKPKDTCATPEEAYAQAQKALTMFSSALNKGIAEMETAQTVAIRMQENINEQLNRINPIEP